MNKKLEFSTRLAALKPSATVEMTERVRQARERGADIISLASGDPNFATHPEVLEAARRSLSAGETHYGPSYGKLSLRETIARRLEATSSVAYDPTEILVTPGGKFGVFASIMAVVNPGDEVITFEPGWVSYGPCVKLAGGVPVSVPALDRIDPGVLSEAITAHTRMIIVNSPVNPTGRAIPRDELTAILELAEKCGLWILFDEVYAELVYEPDVHTALHSLDGARERTFVVNSFSKTYGMSGWRIGYLAVPASVSKSVLKFLQHSIYCVPPFIQTAAEAALALPHEVIAGQVDEFRKRRDMAVARLNKVQGIACEAPPATFYLFPSVEGNDSTIAKEWLDKLSVAVLPGSAFGETGRGHLRISLTINMSLLDEALMRIEKHYAS